MSDRTDSPVASKHDADPDPSSAPPPMPTPARGGDTSPASPLPLWLKGVAPLVLIGLLVFMFFKVGPIGVFQKAFPPVEELTIDRITLPAEGELRVRVVNGGPEPVTIAQVFVDDASWIHYIDGDRKVGRLENRTIAIPYPWVEGDPLHVTLVTSTGLTFGADVAVATLTPSVDARYLTTFALLGLYVGVIPVFLGMLWFPFLRTISRRWLDFFLSLTIGLLVFLGVDALAEALETSSRVAGAFQGLSVVLLGAIGTPLVLTAFSNRTKASRGERSALGVAMLIALGIGLHNLGEGLAIGAAYSTGEIALGTFLVVGFLLHNTTEGIGILAPIATERPGLRNLVMLGALAGVPTIVGAWMGAFVYSPLWTTFFFAVGAGAIAQVVYELWRLFARRAEGGLASPLNALGVLAGLVLMYSTGLLVSA